MRGGGDERDGGRDEGRRRGDGSGRDGGKRVREREGGRWKRGRESREARGGEWGGWEGTKIEKEGVRILRKEGEGKKIEKDRQNDCTSK